MTVLHRALLALLLLPALLAPAAAHAQDHGDTVVARQGDAVLAVHDDGDELCVSLRVGRRSSSTCSGLPAGRFGGTPVEWESGRRSFAGGVVAPETAQVEVELARGGRVRGTVVPGEAYTGNHRGKVAFFLVETTGASAAEADTPVLNRRFDAAGALIGAFGAHGRAEVAEPLTLLRARGADGVGVRARATRWFEPSPLAIDRAGRVICLSAQGRYAGRSTCRTVRTYGPTLSMQPLVGCGRFGGVVAGLTSARVARVELTLGDGRRIARRTRALASLGVPHRAVALRVGPGLAVRSATALDAGGRALGTEVIGSPPAPARCDSGGGSDRGLAFQSDSRYVPSPLPAAGEQVVAGTAPGPRLVARDAGEELCVGVDFIADDGSECEVPPVESGLPGAWSHRRTDRHTAVGGVLPPGASGVRIQFDGRDWVTAEATGGDAYTGLYRGHVRFFLAAAEGPRRVTAVETFDGNGTTILAFPGHDALLEVATIRRIYGLRLFGGRYDFRVRFPGEEDEFVSGTCVGLAGPGETPHFDRCEDLGMGGAFGRVSCTPRGGVLVGRASRGVRGVRLGLAGGGELRSRSVRVPAAAGGGRLWVVSIPPSAEIVRLRYVGTRSKPPRGRRPRQSGVYRVPAPREQCGYALPSPAF